MCTIAADDRERAIIPDLTTLAKPLGIHVEVKRQYIGDYTISRGDELLAIIERKTWTDLSAGLRDGRKENVAKLLYAREQSNALLMYLIEGMPVFKASALIGGIPFKNLMAHLDHLAFRDNITVMYSMSGSEMCARRILELAVNLCTVKEKASKSIVKSTANQSTADPTVVYQMPPESRPLDLVARQTMWIRIPGVGARLATQLAERCSIADVYNQTIGLADIATIKFEHGAMIGEARALKILNSITRLSQQTKSAIALQVKVLSGVRGCSEPTAAYILTQIPCRAIIEGTVSIDGLAQLVRNSNGTSVGPALAEAIITHVCATSATKNTNGAPNNGLPER